MHPAICNQPERSSCGCIVAEIDLNVVVTRNALIHASTESIKIFAVQSVDDAGYVLSQVVNGFRDLARSRDCCNSQLRWRNYESFVDKYFTSFSMIYDHEAEMIVIVRLPELGRNA